MQSNYVSIATGDLFKGEIPKEISIPVSDVVSEGITTQLVTASEGDENYQSVLDTWMFTHGYIRKDAGIITKALVKLKGGAGSGFYGHRGIPGHRGGSLPRNVSLAKVKEPEFIGTFTEKEKEHIKKDVQLLCDEFGYPADKVIIDSTDGYAFTVGSTSYRSAAQYDPKTGKITLFSGSMSNMGKGEYKVSYIQKSIFSHEVMHSRFHKFQKLSQRQKSLLERLAPWNRTEPEGYIDEVTGGISEQHKEEFWAYDIWLRYYRGKNNIDKLFETAVSDYGNSYIQTAQQPKSYGVDITRAVDENLAEAACSVFSIRDYSDYSISKRWYDLYNEINEGLLSHGLIKNYPKILDINKGF